MPAAVADTAPPSHSAAPERRAPRDVLNIVLVEPQIPPNTGNIARLCAAAGCHLILAGPLGFALDDARLKRAGLDYWEHVSWEHVADAEAFLTSRPRRSLHLLSARATELYTRIPAQWGDYLVFGKETVGLGAELLERYSGQCYTVPIVEQGVRSLNLSSAVAIVTYDVLRRLIGL